MLTASGAENRRSACSRRPERWAIDFKRHTVIGCKINSLQAKPEPMASRQWIRAAMLWTTPDAPAPRDRLLRPTLS
ncbi:MAG: hypothetical protein ACLQE9_10850 [Roseiarcus sp.]